MTSVSSVSQALYILRLLAYSAIISAVIKYAAPNWVLLTHNLNVDIMNAIAISLITLPVGLFAFVLWLKR
ncbi:hypothetical protein [Pseudanabaena mucicola]|uniref:Uncharacterized protein n=1 Tax=Pseudanabaena mucicola FACHB-723 TaxID=2692860 RepID=A0ABR8A0U3_9CYAN|nr:hypothetical protein [Pseudanabaena mucicola]MBD2189787.1 hypothetical protein [Pseudanabaena mucicola FACHB-723]